MQSNFNASRGMIYLMDMLVSSGLEGLIAADGDMMGFDLGNSEEEL